MRKHSVVLAATGIVAAAVLLLASCGAGGGGGKAIVLKYARGGSHDTSPENARVKKAIEDKFAKDTGIRVDLQPVYYDWDNIIQKYNVDIAGGTAPDAVRFWPAQHFENWFKGQYQPLNDLVSKYAPNMAKRFAPDEIEAAKVKGTITGLPLGGKPINYLLAIRTDKMQQYGITMPTTLDQLEQAMDIYKKKEPKNSPFMFYWAGGIRYISALAGLPMDRDSLYVTDDGRVTSVYMHPNQSRYIGLFAKWYKNGWVTKDSLTQGEDAESLFMKGRGLMVQSYVAGGLNFIYDTLKKTDPNATGAMVPELTAPWGNQTLFLDGFNSEGYLGIIKTTKPDVAQVLVKFYNWEIDNRVNFQLTRRGQEGVDYTIQDGKLDKPAKWKADGAQPYNWEYVMVADPFLNGGDLDPIDVSAPPGTLDAYAQVKTAIANRLYIDNPIKHDPYLPVGDLAPKLTAVNQKLGQLQAEIITGKRPLTDWDKAAQIWKDGGGADIEAALTKSYQDLKK